VSEWQQTLVPRNHVPLIEAKYRSFVESLEGRSMMKRALTGIASVGILALTVGAETANAQPYRRSGPARTYTPQAYPPQSRGSVPRGVPRTVPFSDPNSPQATGGGSLGYNRGLPHNE
jgi:hypothetical protein